MRSARQSRSTSATVFARLAGRQLVRLREIAERELRVGAVDAGDDRLGDERRRPVRDELAEPLERADLDVDAGGGENDAVGVARARVGDLVVQRRAQLVAAAKLAPRPRASGRSLSRARSHAVSTSTSRRTTKRVAQAAPRTSDVSTAPPPTRVRPRGSGRAAASRDRVSASAFPERAARPSDEQLGVERQSSMSTNSRPRRRATSAPIVVLPAPMKPTRTRWRF